MPGGPGSRTGRSIPGRGGTGVPFPLNCGHFSNLRKPHIWRLQEKQAPVPLQQAGGRRLPQGARHFPGCGLPRSAAGSRLVASFTGIFRGRRLGAALPGLAGRTGHRAPRHFPWKGPQDLGDPVAQELTSGGGKSKEPRPSNSPCFLGVGGGSFWRISLVSTRKTRPGARPRWRRPEAH